MSSSIEETISCLRKRSRDPELLLALKSQSRALHNAAYESKESLRKVRKETDAAYLETQTKRTEVMHLERELARCLATEWYDALDFAEEEQVSSMNTQRKLERAKTELLFRQQLVVKIKEAESRKLAMAAEIKVKKNVLNDIPAKLAELEAAAKELKEQIGQPSQEEIQTEFNASKLPAPLRTVFKNFEALASVTVFGSLFKVKIANDSTLDIEFSKKKADAITKLTFNLDESCAMEGDGAVPEVRCINALDDQELVAITRVLGGSDPSESARAAIRLIGKMCFE